MIFGEGKRRKTVYIQGGGARSRERTVLGMAYFPANRDFAGTFLENAQK